MKRVVLDRGGYCAGACILALTFQIRIRARDSGTPFSFNTTVCVVTITRNFQPPVFTDQQYSAFVPETFPLGDVILSVNAIDNDPLVSALRPSLAGNCFANSNNNSLCCFRS